MRNEFMQTLLVEASTNKNIVLLTGDLGYGVVDDFARELPSQFMNFGINEQTMMGAAAGLANRGFKPFVYSIGNFPTFRCLEQIRNDVCFMNSDVVIIALGAGFAYGTAGYSHHLIEDISAISPLANIRIHSPADILETRIVCKEVTTTPGPHYVRLGKGGEGSLTQDFNRDLKGLSILSGSSEIAIISTGNILCEVLRATEQLKGEKPTIISCHDFSALENYLRSTQFPRIITVEEHINRGGFGSLVQELLTNQKTVVQRIALKAIDTRVSGSQSFLRKHYKLDAETIKLNLI